MGPSPADVFSAILSLFRSPMSRSDATLTRAKRLDRVMTWLISLGGMTIIAAVLGILVFIGKEALPLFWPAKTKTLASVAFPKSEALWVEESAKAVIALDTSAGLRAHTLADGKLLRVLEEGPPRPWQSILAPDAKGQFAILDQAERLHLGKLKWDKPAGDNNPSQWNPSVEWGEPLKVGPGLKSLVALRVREGGGLSGSKVIRVVARQESGAFAWAELTPEAQKLPDWKPLLIPQQSPTAALWSGDGQLLLIGTESGHLLAWDPEAETLRAESVTQEPIRTLGFALGQNSVLVGGERGGLAAIQILRKDGRIELQNFHQFKGHGQPILGFMASGRDKRFLAWSSGRVTVDHLTTERRLLEEVGTQLEIASLSPRGEQILAWGGGTLRKWHLDSPHPEVSPKTLWGKVHYEGYEKPENTWQSTGGGDDFEPKFGLMPLVFGTFKGTLAAMIFALPLSILGALYTSQFASHRFRNLIKPAIEVMAALPSVVLGFLAGLVLAPLFERSVIHLLLWPVFILCTALVLLPLWRLIPAHVRNQWAEGREVLMVLPILFIGFALTLSLAPAFERVFLGGDFRAWLLAKQGLTYDQRNALVVGFAMGFAVIPIIFTISEDALSSVPRSLSSASLACGASPWQTAWRVVVPTASPGIFSAVMVGFGRAIGETMIVLMATGNTPLMDWSPFNGMRTLAANIAVETPEAPLHGTLYRVLFLTALLLFALTFFLNTLAELVRQHLRKRYESF